MTIYGGKALTMTMTLVVILSPPHLLYPPIYYSEFLTGTISMTKAIREYMYNLVAYIHHLLWIRLHLWTDGTDYRYLSSWHKV